MVYLVLMTYNRLFFRFLCMEFRLSMRFFPEGDRLYFPSKFVIDYINNYFLGNSQERKEDFASLCYPSYVVLS